MMKSSNTEKANWYHKLPQIEDFYLYLNTNNFSPKTVYSYKKDIAMFGQFLYSRNLDIRDMTKRDLFEFKAYLTSDERKTETETAKKDKSVVILSPASLNRCLSAIRAYLKFLTDQEYRLNIVPDQLKMVKRNKKYPNIAELKELVSLIESPSHLEGDPVIAIRNRAMLEVLFATGIRISELMALNTLDVNDTGRILITGKGRKQRFIYLTDRAKQHIDHYLQIRSSTQQALFIPTKGRTINNSRLRLTARYLQERIKKYREVLKINIPTSAHSLRHGFATYLAENGASVVAIQMLLGHESLDTTTRYINTQDKFAEESHHKFHPLSKFTK